MAVKRITEQMKKEMRDLFVKAYLPCEEIGDRAGVSRQSVSQILKKMGVNTSKRRFVMACSECGTPVEKTRAEVRKYENHFCSTQCYKMWLKRPDVQEETQKRKVIRDIWAKVGTFTPGESNRYFATDNDILVFKDKEEMLEWKRTGLHYAAYSTTKGKNVLVAFGDVTPRVGFTGKTE